MSRSLFLLSFISLLFIIIYMQMSPFLTAKTGHMSKFGRFSPGAAYFFGPENPRIGNFLPSSGIIRSPSPQIITERV